MKIALAQMAMTDSVEENLQKSLAFCQQAKDCDLLFFPEIQLSPFFPQYEKKNADRYCLQANSLEVQTLREQAQKYQYYCSLNLYMEEKGRKYDTSLWIDPAGKLAGKAKMVHIAQAEQFYEQDYYTPSDEGLGVRHGIRQNRHCDLL
jgi:predicted amidohydrolase